MPPRTLIGGVQRAASGAGDERCCAKHVTCAASIAFSGATKTTRTHRGGAILGNLAYITSENKVTGTFKSKPVSVNSIETMVLHKAGTAWKILHIHWSSRDAK